MTTPITSALFRPAGFARAAAGFFDLTAPFATAGCATLVIAGISALTSRASLSCRSPLNAACRTLPSPVQPANSISATNSGFSQCTSRILRGAFLPPNGLSSDAAAFSAGMIAFTLSWPKPVPTMPTKAR